jgi:tRNA uridine 5-carboxymethylaminomethyl modification enzyme
LFAGINAALQCRSMSGAADDFGGAWTPGRDQAYLGVLVDDLTTKGVTEPYRMFTSRAEFRLQLREDNADVRLTEVGRQMGLVDDARWEAFSRKQEAVSRETERLKSIWINPRSLPVAESERVLGKAIDREYNLADLLRRPNVSYQGLMSLDGAKYQNQDVTDGFAGDDVSRETTRAIIEQIEIAAKYSGYIDRQRDEVERAAHYENLKLPEDLDYNQVTALSIEVRQRLSRQRPETLGQASRMSGITPAAISLLLIHLKRSRVKGFAQEAAVSNPTEAV